MLNNEIEQETFTRRLTSQQSRINVLKTQKHNASKVLDSERKHQKAVKAQQNSRNALSA